MGRRNFVRTHSSIDGIAGWISHDHSRGVALAVRRPAVGPQPGRDRGCRRDFAGNSWWPAGHDDEGSNRNLPCLRRSGFSWPAGFHRAGDNEILALAGKSALSIYKNFRAIKALAIAITVAIYIQLALGATMRHQHRDLAILDFPTANGAWLPDTSVPALAKINAWRDARALSDVTAFQIWLQMAHRFLALIIAIAIIAFCVRVLREARRSTVLQRLSVLWVALVLCQIALGGWVIWSNKAADVATAHVAIGAVMLSFGVSISAICWRISQPGKLVGRGRRARRITKQCPHENGRR